MNGRLTDKRPACGERRAVASYVQEELFDAADDGWSVVNVPVELRLRGPVDVPRLQEAFDALVARHEGLRTRLVRSSAGVEQRITATTRVNLARTTFARKCARIDLRDAVRKQAIAPFRVVGGELFRASLFTLNGQDHVVALTVHHAISDGWSRRVVADDLVALYEAPGELEVPAGRFSDYACVERNWETSGRLGHWRQLVGEFPPRAVIEQSPPRPLRLDNQSFRSIRPHDTRSGLSATRTRRLAQMAAEEETTLAPALIAAAAAAVAKWTGDRLSIGMWHANRERRELRGVVGCLADLMPVAVDMSGDPTFRELVARVGEAYEDAIEHRVPTGVLVPLLRGQDRGRLFDVVVNYLPGGARRARGSNRKTGATLTTEVAVSEVNLAKGVIVQPARQWPSTAAIAVFRPEVSADGTLYGFAGGCYIDGMEWPAGMQERFGKVLEAVTARPYVRLSTLQDQLAAIDVQDPRVGR